MPFDIASFRALAASVRQIASPLHTTSCTIRTRTWNEGEIGSGVFSDSDFQLGSEVRVSQVTSKEIMTSGGFFNFNDVKVEHITPAFPGGGYTLDQIAPATQFPPASEAKLGLRDPADPAVEYIYLLTGDINGTYRLLNLSADHALHYTLYLRELDVHAQAHAL